METDRLSTILSGVAGEYFVAAELSRRGYIASISLRNTKGVDILAADEAGTKTALIQVKTNQGSKQSWVLGEKAEKQSSGSLFYVFVALRGKEGAPSYHVVPSAVVAKEAAENHAAWLSGTKKDGSSRKDTSMRKFSDFENKYKDAWHKLGLG